MKPKRSFGSDQETIGKGYMIGLSVISVAAQFVIIPAIGLWIDKQCGTGLLFAAIGLALGMYTGIRQLMRI